MAPTTEVMSVYERERERENEREGERDLRRQAGVRE